MAKRQRRKAPTPMRAATPAQIAAARERAKRQEQETRYKKSVRYFRPRKTERGSIVFLTKDGKRATGRTRKGYAVYVNRKGKVQPYRETETVETKAGKRRQRFKAPRLVRKGEVVPRQFKSKKAAAKWQAQFIPLREKEIRIRPRRGRNTVDFFDDIVPKVTRQILDSMQAVRNVHAQIKIVCSFSYEVEETGEIKTDSATVNFNVAMNQLRDGLTDEGWEHFFRYSLYPAIADRLAEHDFVSVGSAQFIADLPDNQDEEDMSKWKRSDGLPWSKWDYDQVRIFDFAAMVGIVKTSTTPQQNKATKDQRPKTKGK